jgi:RNA polymerase sigma factor (sigma-70 family)
VDPALVSRAQEGDHDAFAMLATDSIGRLNAVAMMILHDRDQAQDAVQDTLVEAWRGIRGLRDPDRWEAWVNRLLVRACRRHAKREWRRRVAEVPLLVIDGPDIPDTQHALAIHDEMERALRRLLPDQRAVLVLAYYLDLSLADAAHLLDIPVGTMKSRLNRALLALRAAIAADERSPVGLATEQQS